MSLFDHKNQRRKLFRFFQLNCMLQSRPDTEKATHIYCLQRRDANKDDDRYCVQVLRTKSIRYTFSDDPAVGRSDTLGTFT